MNLDDPEYESDAYLYSDGAWPYGLPDECFDFNDREGEQEDDKRTAGIMLWAGVVVVNPRRHQYARTEGVDNHRRERPTRYGYADSSAASGQWGSPDDDDDIPF